MDSPYWQQCARVMDDAIKHVGIHPQSFHVWLDALSAWITAEFGGDTQLADVTVAQLKPHLEAALDRTAVGKATRVDDEFISVAMVMGPILQKMVAHMVECNVDLETQRAELFKRLGAFK